MKFRVTSICADGVGAHINQAVVALEQHLNAALGGRDYGANVHQFVLYFVAVDDDPEQNQRYCSRVRSVRRYKDFATGEPVRYLALDIALAPEDLLAVSEADLPARLWEHVRLAVQAAPPYKIPKGFRDRDLADDVGRLMSVTAHQKTSLVDSDGCGLSHAVPPASHDKQRFRFTIMPVRSADVDTLVMVEYLQRIAKRIDEVKFECKLAFIFMQIVVVNPKVAPAKDAGQYKKKDNAYVFRRVLDFDRWQAAQSGERLEMLNRCVVDAIYSIPMTYLDDGQKSDLTGIVNDAGQPPKATGKRPHN